MRNLILLNITTGLISGAVGGGIVSYWGFKHLGKHHHEVFKKFYELHKR